MSAARRTLAKAGAVTLGCGLAIALSAGAATAVGSGPSTGGSTEPHVTKLGSAVNAKPPAIRGSGVRGTHAVHG